jgi:RNA polymerase sigma-70 factor (ECF subfamily)
MRPGLSIPIPFADGAPSMKRPGIGAIEGAEIRRMDEGAFRALYLETAANLRAYIRRACGDASLADDILQETFYRFLRMDLPRMEKFQTKAYLYRTASSLLCDHWRRVKRERSWSLKRLFGAETASPAEPDGDAMRLFQKLKPQEQSLLWLAYVEGFDHGEIACALQLKERSVRVLVFRARGKLAGLLREQGFGPEEIV